MTRHTTTLFILIAFSHFAITRAEAQIYPAPNEVGDCSVAQYANCDSGPDQGQLELPGSSGAQNGNWDDLPGGVSARPYVQRLSVINGGVETVLIASGSPSAAMSNTPGSVGVNITPTNLCDSTESPSNPGDNCYATPNRIQVTVVYRKSPGQVGSNLSFPNSGDQGTTSGSAVPLKSFDGSTDITINSDTIIDLTLALNTLGQSLRWTWLNGIPSFWALNNLGDPSATVRVKFKPAAQPSIHYQTTPAASTCTRIPVNECEVSRSSSDWLSATMVMSLDETLSAGMTGSLFGTEGAIIGSVDASTNSTTGLPGLTYGVASSHLDYSGGERSATMRAFIPAAGLVQVLGIPSFSSLIGAATDPASVIGVQRTDASSTSTNAFEVWSEREEGANGLLLTITGITFSAPQYEVKGKSGTPKVPSVRFSRGTYSFTLQGSTTGALGSCKTKPCSVTVYRAPSSIYSSTISLVSRKSATVGRGKLSASFSLKKSSGIKAGTKLLVLVTNNQKRVLASTPVTLR